MFLLLAVALLGQTTPDLKIRDHNCELTHGWSAKKSEVKLWIEHVDTDEEPISLVFWYPFESKARKKITYKNTPIYVMIGSGRLKKEPLRFSRWVSGKSMKAARLWVNAAPIGNETWIYERSESETKHHESLVQAITWGDLLAMANAADVSGYAGESHFTLTQEELEGVRDFAARLGHDQAEVDAAFGEPMDVPYNRLMRLMELVKACRAESERLAKEGPDDYSLYAAAFNKRVVFLARKYGYPVDAGTMFNTNVEDPIGWRKIQKNRS